MDINLDKLTDQDIMERMNAAYNEYTKYWNEINDNFVFETQLRPFLSSIRLNLN